jgi:hypothetical protein
METSSSAEVRRLLDDARQNVANEGSNGVEVIVSFATIGAVAGVAERAEVYRGDEAGCYREVGAASYGSVTSWLVTDVARSDGRIPVTPAGEVPDAFMDGAVQKVPGMARCFQNLGDDRAEIQQVLTNLKQNLGRYYKSIVGSYGGAEVDSAWDEETKAQVLLQTLRDCIPVQRGQVDRSIKAMDLSCLGAPTAEQLPVVIQRLLYVRDGCRGQCPTEAYKEKQEKPQRLAKQINDGLDLADEGLTEKHQGKLQQAKEMLMSGMLAIALYDREVNRVDVYGTLLSTTVGQIKNVVGALKLTESAAATAQPAGAEVTQGGVVTAAATNVVSEKTDEEKLMATVQGGKYVLGMSTLEEQVRLVSESIVEKKSGAVLVTALHRSTKFLSGTVRATMEEVGASAVRKYGEDLTRGVGLPQMVSLLGFHGRGVTLRPFGKVAWIEERDFNDVTNDVVQDLGKGKVTTQLGSRIEYKRIESVEDVANALQNVGAALSCGFENAELLRVRSLLTAADYLLVKSTINQHHKKKGFPTSGGAAILAIEP